MAPGKEFAKTCNRIPSPTLLGFVGDGGCVPVPGGTKPLQREIVPSPCSVPRGPEGRREHLGWTIKRK